MHVNYGDCGNALTQLGLDHEQFRFGLIMWEIENL